MGFGVVDDRSGRREGHESDGNHNTDHFKVHFHLSTEFRPDPKRKLNVAEFCESNDGLGASSLDFIGTHWSVQVCRVDQTYSRFWWYRTMVAECFLQLGGCDLARCCRSIDSEIFNDFFRFHFDSVFHGHFRPWYF